MQLGAQVARVYYNLGKVSGDSTSIEKSNKILEHEIMHYAGFVRFFQSLSASQYDRLTNSDKYVDQQYLVTMLSDYYEQCGDKKYNEMIAKLEAAGVNIQRLQSFQEAYEQELYQRQLQAQAQAQASQNATSEGSSSELSEILGN